MPAFPFGHGLSYSSFSYSELVVDSGAMTVTFKVANTGGVAAAEVAQLYLGFPSAANEPPQQLKGFQKVYLGVGESTKITFKLQPRDVSIWDAVSAKHGWVLLEGTFAINVGSSSRNIHLTGSLILKKEGTTVPLTAPLQSKKRGN